MENVISQREFAIAMRDLHPWTVPSKSAPKTAMEMVCATSEQEHVIVFPIISARIVERENAPITAMVILKEHVSPTESVNATRDTLALVVNSDHVKMIAIITDFVMMELAYAWMVFKDPPVKKQLPQVLLLRHALENAQISASKNATINLWTVF